MNSLLLEPTQTSTLWWNNIQTAPKALINKYLLKTTILPIRTSLLRTSHHLRLILLRSSSLSTTNNRSKSNKCIPWCLPSSTWVLPKYKQGIPESLKTFQGSLLFHRTWGKVSSHSSSSNNRSMCHSTSLRTCSSGTSGLTDHLLILSLK